MVLPGMAKKCQSSNKGARRPWPLKAGAKRCGKSSGSLAGSTLALEKRDKRDQEFGKGFYANKETGLQYI